MSRKSRNNKEKGVITVEAITTLVIFMMFFWILISFMDMVKSQIVVQSAVTETAKELSTYCYIASKAGLFDFQDEVSASAEKNDQLSKLADSYKSLTGTLQSGSVPSEDEFSKIINILKNISTKSFTAPALNAGLQAGGDAAIGQASEILAKKYLSSYDLEKLGIVNGYEGLDFSESHFPYSGDKTLRITVSYEVTVVKVPYFENLDLKKKVVLNASTRIWGN